MVTPQPERPRDELGRPLPAGSANRLELPDFEAMTLDECHEASIACFDTGNYFAAHEGWETCWRQVRGTEEEAFFQGLAQLGAGFTHWTRGNAHGAVALLGRALARISTRGSPYRGIDVEAFVALTSEVRERALAVELDGAALGELGEVRVPRG